MAVTGRIEGAFQGILRGWVWDSDRAAERLLVEILVDGRSLGVMRADRRRGDLGRNGIGDGGHGFECPLPLELQDGGRHGVTLRLSDGDEARDIAVATLELPLRAHMLQGKVERLIQDHLHGWVFDRARPNETLAVELLHEGVVVASAAADRFRRDLLSAGIGNGAHGFAFDLGALPRPLPPGAALTVRLDAAFDRWEVGHFTLPSQGGAAWPDLAAPAPSPPPGKARAPKVNVAEVLDAAREAERRRDFPEAARILDRSLAVERRNFDLLFLRARVALALNDAERAEACARRALAERPGHVRPTVILARLAGAANNHAEAAALWAVVPEGDTNYRERLVKRGRCLMMLGRPVEALAEFAAAVRLDATDRDALRGAAEATEAVGGLRAAMRRWRDYLAIVPDDAVATKHLQELERRFAPLPGLASPLRNPVLRDWPAGLEGEATVVAAEPSPGVVLRPLSPAGRLRYAAAEARERRPGELPGYGLWLRAEGGGCELAFALDPAVATVLDPGLRMAIELRGLGCAAEDALDVALDLRGDAAGQRRLGAWRIGSRPRMLRFDLHAEGPERTLLPRGRLWLTLRLGGPGTLLVLPPRPIALLHAAPAPRAAFETPGLAAALGALGLLPAPPPPRAAAAVERVAAPFTVVRIEPGAQPAAAVLASVEATLRERDVPLACLVPLPAAPPADLAAALARLAAADPRLRLAAPPVLPPGTALLHLAPGEVPPPSWVAARVDGAGIGAAPEQAAA